MKIVVASFYADIPGKPSRFDEFLPLVLASKRALEITNPDARYVVLTDRDTSLLFDNMGIESTVVCSTQMPLMLKILFAQKIFVMTTSADLVVLPDVDCLANRSFVDVTPEDVGFATTHRGPKFEYKINNLAYIRDKELAAWFFERAIRILKGWSREMHEWEGDQAAWEASLAPPVDSSTFYSFENLGGDHLVSRPEGRAIHIYPCDTHNCIAPDGGNFKPKHEKAFMVHLKGDRKRHLGKWMVERFGDERFNY